ncbi:MAG: type II secretion system F family protein [Ignavibacteriales bacterium]|nr:MAG: type II secretion system F family protein [Ignavibacteriales bacterium]
MVECRFVAENPSGKVLSGSLVAENLSEAKKKINAMAEKNQLKIKSIDKKAAWIYTAKKGNEKPIKGEQKAFNKQEVIDALTRLGYDKINVNKKLLDINPPPPVQDVVTFVKISSELMDQKLPFGEVMNLLINDTQNKTLRDTLKDINNELKKGADSQVVFSRYQSVFGKFTSYMLGLASKSGNMAEIYRATAKFLERQMEFKKSLKSALISPFVTVFVLMLAVLYYIGYIFPETALMFAKFGIDLPPMTAATLELSDFLKANIFLILGSIIVPIVVLGRFFATPKGRIMKDKYMLKMPVMGNLIHKTVIEVFCRVFYTLYSGSAESIEPIRIAAEASDNAYFESQIKNVAIPLMVKKGIGITEAFAAANVFTETALNRFHSGEETGTLKNTALQLANYYESETVFRLKSIIELIQVIISMIIMVVMIGLTLVSAETATISPDPNKMKSVLEFVREYPVC